MLSRRFSPLHLLMLSINGMVGSAWLFAPLYAAKIAGSSALIAWIIGGLATAVIALTFAELSVMFPVAGGTAQIPMLSHGALTSFIISWVAWLSALTMAPIEVQAILQYASTYFTSLMTLHHGVPILTTDGFLMASLLMLLFCAINIYSYKGLTRFNSVIFAFKIAVIIITIFALLHTQFYPANFSGISANLQSWQGWQAILGAIATGGIAFAFTGFKHGVELAGEAKNLQLAIPLAIVGSVLICALLYFGLQLAFIGVLDAKALQAGFNHLSFAGDIGPFAGLAVGLGLFWLAKLLYIDAVVSPAGAGLIYMTSTSRILYAMSQIGYLPRFLSKLNSSHFPFVAIIVNFLLGMFIFLPFPGWQAMVSFLVSGMVISYAIGPIALICLRLQLPHHERAFRLPFAYGICLLAFYFCNLLTYWTGWETIYKLSIAIILGIVFFSLSVFRRKIAIKNLGLKSTFWLLPYLSGLILISYLGAFGGHEIIPFGWDFVIIGFFSVAIFYLAVKNRARLVLYPNSDCSQHEMITEKTKNFVYTCQ